MTALAHSIFHFSDQQFVKVIHSVSLSCFPFLAWVEQMSANANSWLLGGSGGDGSWLITSTQRCTQGETAFYMLAAKLPNTQRQAQSESHLARTTVATAEHQIWRNQMHHLKCEWAPCNTAWKQMSDKMRKREKIEMRIKLEIKRKRITENAVKKNKMSENSLLLQFVAALIIHVHVPFARLLFFGVGHSAFNFSIIHAHLWLTVENIGAGQVGGKSGK